MPLDAERALAAALLARLRADPGVTASGIGSRVHDQPPADPGYPYLVLGRSDARPFGGGNGEGVAGEGLEIALTLIPTGAAFALLDTDLVRAQVGASERGLPLTWRAAPAGGPCGGLAMEEASFTWRGIAWRPWSPARLRAARSAAGVTLSWVRRARVHGDGWDGADPPLGEEAESYRMQVLSGVDVVREWVATAPQVLYTAVDIATDFLGVSPASLTVRIAQGSAVFGWGVPAQRTLWL